jgi:hypothetical protein
MLPGGGAGGCEVLPCSGAKWVLGGGRQRGGAGGHSWHAGCIWWWLLKGPFGPELCGLQCCLIAMTFCRCCTRPCPYVCIFAALLRLRSFGDVDVENRINPCWLVRHQHGTS